LVRTTLALEQREEIRQAARTARAEANRVYDETVRIRQQSRQLGGLVAKENAGGIAGRVAFAALPVPAALLDAEGTVTAVNPAWRGLKVVCDAIAVGSDFGASWSALTGDAFFVGNLKTVVRTASPMQAETTVRGESPMRLLVQVGPAALREGRGTLVVLVDLTVQYEREQTLLFDATHDPLTGIANRAWLQRALGQALDRLRRYDERFAIIYLDLDEFKPLNDQHGHAVGDAVLRQVAERWDRIVRRPDLLARVGGDEFVVLVEHITDADAVRGLGDRMSAALDEEFVCGDVTVPLSVTVGIATPPSWASADDALALADQAMYQQKPRRS